MRIDAKYLGLAALALLAAPAVQAQQAPTKVAIINIQSAILATKDGGVAREALRVKFESRSKDLEGRMAEINRKRETLQKAANTLSAEAREKQSREVEDLQKKYQWDAEDFQSDVQQEEQKLVGEIGNRMISIIDEYAKGQNFALVLDVSSQQSPVLWAASGIEITRDIVDLYDKKNAAGAAATPAAKPATPTAPPDAAPKKPAGVK
ncbi:MAG: OmpH family outer membrane protein [Bryobacteraceae bacterium]|nr:OmpH family outer membrane protein [Bryobacteraceae bacterium]